jgi:hypothetical protein
MENLGTVNNTNIQQNVQQNNLTNGVQNNTQVNNYNITMGEGMSKASFLNQDKQVQEYSVYNYVNVMYQEAPESGTSNDIMEKLQQLIELLQALEMLKELLDILLEGQSQNQDNTKNQLGSILENMNGYGSFEYFEASTEVEMSANEFIQIMDHMNSSELYTGLSEEEKMYKIMETAQGIGTTSLYNGLA